MLYSRFGKKTGLDTVRFLEYPDFLAGINTVRNLFFFFFFGSQTWRNTSGKKKVENVSFRVSVLFFNLD